MAGSTREFFDDTILEFLGEMSEASEDDIDALFEALPLDWETTPPPSAPSLPAIGEPHPSFAHTTLEDLERLRAKNVNVNTAKSTRTWVKRFNKWRTERQIAQNLEEIPKGRLDGILQLFFAEIRKNDGTNYEPDSLRTMLAALDRHLREKGSTFSILKDREFDASRKVLNGKAIELQEQGLGKRKHRADPVNEEEEELLWSQKVLGGDTALNFNLTVSYFISQQFGTRGCQKHHQLRVEHLKFVNSPCTGTTENVEWVEGPTKTGQAGLRKVNRRITQRMFDTSDSRCPVRYLERLISKRPQHIRNSGPLYLQPLSKPNPDVWYSIQSVGINKIDGFMKKIATMGGLDITKKHFTNHSVRKTTVRKLQKAGVSNDKIIAITGHKTEQSIKAYVDTDLEDHRHISTLLYIKPKISDGKTHVC